MDEFYIDFDTLSDFGKLDVVKIGIGMEKITDMNRQLNIALCNHPLYPKLVAYVQANPVRE